MTRMVPYLSRNIKQLRIVTTQVTSLLPHDGVPVMLESSSLTRTPQDPQAKGMGSALLAPYPEPKLKQPASYSKSVLP